MDSVQTVNYKQSFTLILFGMAEVAELITGGEVTLCTH
jgi:hypothetical protein